MERNIWKDAFGKLEMSTESKEKIWESLEQKKEQADRVTGNKRSQKFTPKKWIAAAIICICFLGITLIEVFTDGKIVDAVEKLWKVEESSQRVIEHTVDYRVTLDGFYAPELIECSEKRIIFASSMGVIIYDKEKRRVAGTIDLQEIESNFLFCIDPTTTRFLQEGEQLVVYNEDSEEEKVQGNCYVYDLTQCSSLESGEIVALKPIEITPATDELIYMWKEKMKKFQKKTDKEYKNIEDVFCRWHSKYCLRWKTADGEEYSSCLTITDMGNGNNPKDSKYVFEVYHKNLKTNQVAKEVLELTADIIDSTTEEKLPEYEYTGDDLVLKALSECARDNLKLYHGYSTMNPGAYWDPELADDAIALPVINIYEIKEGKKYTKVYGKFAFIDVVRYGNLLYDSDSSDSGYGGALGCAYLQKTSDGYKVKKIVHPGDGAAWLEGMIELCDGDEEFAKKLIYIDDDGEKLKQEMVRVIKEYVKINQMDIRYYKSSRETIEIK